MTLINSLLKLKNYLQKRASLLLWLFIFIYIIIFTTFCLFKYHTFSYNGVDLAIYNQVFYHSSSGNLFEFTIHPHLYLGDHFELFILILLPFYFIFKSPLTLLFLQTLFLGLSAWPLYLIAKDKLGRLWALFFALIFLLNPLVQNANLFEFHILPFAIFFLLFTFYFYQRKNFKYFFIFSLLSLLIREDVSLVILMFGFLALIDKRKIKWILAPIILGGVWFIVSFHLISYFNHDNNYKFLIYYSWLGNTPSEIIKNVFLHPWLLLRHLLTFQNLILIFVFLITQAFLPLFALRYLIPSFLIFLQLFLSGFSDLIFKTHYHCLITPFLFVSSIYGLYYLIKSPKTTKIKKVIWREKTLFIVLLITGVVYSCLALGPIIPCFWKIWQSPNNLEENKLKNDFLAETSKNLPVAAGFQFLPQLSNRNNLYSLHYAFLGKQQFSQEDYLLPEDTEEMLVDFNDFIIYQIQSQYINTYSEQYASGDERIREIIKKRNFGLAKIIDNYALFKKDVSDNIRLYEISDTIDPRIEQYNKELGGKIKFIGWRKLSLDSSINQFSHSSYEILPISFSWQALTPLIENYQLLFELTDKNGSVVYKKLYPLAYGLYPTSQWSTDEIVTTNYWFLLPKPFNLINYNVNISLVTPNGYMSLDGSLSVEMKIKDLKILGEKLY